ncbi:hypothetical protein Mgra_00006311 [Meloidogyne graminicola]|uniref:Uncharacterized protein n=1 Tax=Meloidogyne graminicola TaxID=189291 RepID=A0A8S9ZLR3_9BILA|nr:hypothetical protein Mgra_00006311 [Meloidogyne graminicola]
MKFIILFIFLNISIIILLIKNNVALKCHDGIDGNGNCDNGSMCYYKRDGNTKTYGCTNDNDFCIKSKRGKTGINCCMCKGLDFCDLRLGDNDLRRGDCHNKKIDKFI